MQVHDVVEAAPVPRVPVRGGGMFPVRRIYCVGRNYEEPELVLFTGAVRSACGMAGSARRSKETVGDLDLLASSKHPEAVIADFVKMDGVMDVIAQGGTKASVRALSLPPGYQVSEIDSTCCGMAGPRTVSWQESWPLCSLPPWHHSWLSARGAGCF